MIHLVIFEALTSKGFWVIPKKTIGSLCKPFRDVILIPFWTFSLNINAFKKSFLLTRKPLLTVFSLVDVVNASQFVISSFQFDKCDALHDLVSFVQFQKREKHPWRRINFSKVAG